MGTTRRAYEAGHKPKCLVLVDDTSEADRAVHYASRWAARHGGGVVMLRVIADEDRNQQWLGVADIMREEAEDEARAALERARSRALAVAGIEPEPVVREGSPSEQILEVIESDTDIVLLVLAAGTGSDGPGPLIAAIADTAGSFPIPLTVVPGELSDKELEALS
jgi:nucleotide-binding universal stress UspA family protein